MWKLGSSFPGNVGTWWEILEFGGKFCLFVHNKLWENWPASRKINIFSSPGSYTAVFFFLFSFFSPGRRYSQAPDSKTSLMPVFFSFTCFPPSGAAQQHLGFWNFTSGSVWKWRLQWRNSGSPIEWSVAHGTLISAPRYASAWKQCKRR